MGYKIPETFNSKSKLYFGMAGGKRLHIRKRDMLAWCAGFFDGEGYVGVNKQQGRGCTLAACVTQKDRRLLERFVKILGFGKLGKPHKSNGCSAVYFTNSNDVLRLYEHLAPYLGPQKEEQFISSFDTWFSYKRKHGKVQQERKP